jgi:multiple antibiotic resistance protein
MLQGLLSSFVTLFVTIGPVETGVIFAGLTSGVHHKERRSLALRSVSIAGLILIFSAAGGNIVLSLLHISLPAFRVAGGMLVFQQALTLTYLNPGLSQADHSGDPDLAWLGPAGTYGPAGPL